MFFYVYFDPGVFDVAVENGAFGMQSLIGILRGFVQNCFITEFEDYRVQEALKERVEAIPDDNDRKAIKRLLEIMQKRNRFIYCLNPDYTGQKSDLEKVIEQAEGVLIDLILLQSTSSAAVCAGEIKIATLADYQHTDFETMRADLVCNGKALKEGEMFEHAFLEQYFKKALRYAATIDICDKLFGKRFGDNYLYSSKQFFGWLEQILIEPDKCKVLFHCEKPEGRTDDFMKTKIQDFKRGRISNLEVVLQFYKLEDEERCLPHDRYILTDQIAIDFGRGMDFIDRATHRNRDITINIKDLKEVSTLLDSYSAGRLSPVII